MDIWANQFAETPLRSITSMGYSTFIGSGVPPSFSPAYQLPIFAPPDDPNRTFSTLTFQPSGQGVAVPAGWSNWDVLRGRWTASNTALGATIPGGCQAATPCSFSQITTAFPDAVLHGVDPNTGIGGVRLIVGTAVGPGFAAANNWSFGVNGITTVFDFHTGPPPEGYWLVGADGRVFTFGDAQFKGSLGGAHLNAPVVGMAATPDGGGYYLVGADGVVFTFDHAQFKGSLGGAHLNAPVVGMASIG